MTQERSDGAEALDELAQLFPATRSVPVGKTRVTVRALNIVEIGESIDAFEPIVKAWDEASGPMQIIRHHAREVAALAACATDRSAAWLAKIPAGDFLRIGVAVLEVNAPFFEMVGDLMTGETGRRLARLFAGPGPNPSSSSPEAESTPAATPRPLSTSSRRPLSEQKLAVG